MPHSYFAPISQADSDEDDSGSYLKNPRSQRWSKRCLEIFQTQFVNDQEEEGHIPERGESEEDNSLSKSANCGSKLLAHLSRQKL